MLFTLGSVELYEMNWQDFVITAGSIVFGVALIPMIRGKDKPPLLTSVPTATFLTAFVGVYGSLGLWLSTVVGAFSALAWWVLVVQKVRTK